MRLINVLKSQHAPSLVIPLSLPLHLHTLCLGLLGLEVLVSRERCAASDEHDEVEGDTAHAGCWGIGGGRAG